MTQLSGAKGFGARLAQERRLKAAREGRDIQRQDVAKALGVSNSTYGRWEEGTLPVAETMERLAAYFGVRASWLHYGEGERVDAGAPMLPLQKPQRAILPHTKRSGGKGRA